MIWNNNALRTLAALAVLAAGGLWIAKSAISDRKSHEFLAEAATDLLVGSGHVIDQHRDIGDVDSIELDGGYDATITIGSPSSLTISADDNLLPAITSDVEDGNLVISTKGSISTHDRMRLTITVPSLHALQVNSGKISIAGLGGGNLKVDIEGSADVRATGTLADLQVKIDGSGDLHFADLNAASVGLRIEGSGNAAVKASNTLDIVIDGSGDVVYSGTPMHINKAINGSGSVRQAT